MTAMSTTAPGAATASLAFKRGSRSSGQKTQSAAKNDVKLLAERSRC